MLRGKWVEVDHERLKATLERLDAVERLAREEGVSFGQAMRLLAGAEIGGAAEAQAADASWGRVTAGAWLAETLAACRRPETPRRRPSGRGAEGDAAALPGRRRALARLSRRTRPRRLPRRRHGARQDRPGARAAPDAPPAARANARPSLLVAPASLLANWAAEAARFAPSLKRLRRASVVRARRPPQGAGGRGAGARPISS